MVTPAAPPQEQTAQMLHEIGISVHRHGYAQLCIGIPRFAQDSTQCLFKELYPYIAKELNCTDCRAVERAIRSVISDGWQRRDPDVWGSYFPGSARPPSNKLFIATLAERLR